MEKKFESKPTHFLEVWESAQRINEDDILNPREFERALEDTMGRLSIKTIAVFKITPRN